MRRFAACFVLVCLGCAGALRDRADGVAAAVKSAREQNAADCAPRDLATAEANLRFARLELDQGDPFRARQHLEAAEPAAQAAISKSRDCGKVTVLIRQKPPEPAAPKVALKDSDGDGIPDIDDLCPETPGPKETHGCPPAVGDKDGDGVPDNKDACPEVAGPAENAGCPWADRDHDGVPDKDDECPDAPGPADNKGCPRPAPAAPPKTPLIVVRKDRIELKQQLHFQATRAVLLGDSHPVLQQVAQALKDAPTIHVRIEGHTDNVGKRRANLELSQARADAVRDYLISQGVDGNQLSAEGFGSSRPIAPNATRAGRTLNRRVEFRVVEGP